jgi:hypothetical protein
MLLVQFAQEMAPCLAHLTVHQTGEGWLWQAGLDWAGLDWAVLAQQFDTDVFAGARKIIGDFIESGRLWTLLIGIVIGYVLRGLTSYG